MKIKCPKCGHVFEYEEDMRIVYREIIRARGDDYLRQKLYEGYE